jgi:hypothetical protein
MRPIYIFVVEDVGGAVWTCWNYAIRPPQRDNAMTTFQKAERQRNKLSMPDEWPVRPKFPVKRDERSGMQRTLLQ